MDNEFALQSYYVVQGYIDAKDDRGRNIYGTFVSLVTRRDIIFTSAHFEHLEMGKATPWKVLLSIHEEAQKDMNRDPLLLHHEDELHKFLESSLVLTNVAKNLNAKPAEQAISRFCLDDLNLKTVCFVSFAKADDGDVALFKKEEPVSAPAPQVTEDSPSQAPEQGQRTLRQEESKDLLVRCEPILDPISGVAMNGLREGDNVFCRLSADSVIYKLLEKNNPRFDGVVTAKVSGIFMNELGTSTVSLSLSDGIAGFMKLSGKVRVMVVKDMNGHGPRDKKGRRFFQDVMSPLVIPPEFILAAAVIVVVIAAMFALYYIFQI
ncbi:MAG: hypothetical protein LBL73_11375 [Synergistaceae bacterium]|nr:hypothetical protein [Synergistaceae bacterium]